MSGVIHRDRDLAVGRAAEQLAGGLERAHELSRRRFMGQGSAILGAALFGAVTGILGSRTALADRAVKTGQFIIPRLQFSVYDDTEDCWNYGPVGDVNLRKHLRQLTNINASEEPKVVRLNDFDDMCRHPFVLMTQEGYFRLSRREEHNLREFLERGGFILADDCVYKAKEDRFFRCYNKLLAKLFPDNLTRKIPYDHEIFHIYYKFERGCPHMQGVPHGAYGLFERGTGRLMTVNCPGDLHCGWMNCWWKAEKNLEALKMGINIVIYFLSH